MFMRVTLRFLVLLFLSAIAFDRTEQGFGQQMKTREYPTLEPRTPFQQYPDSTNIDIRKEILRLSSKDPNEREDAAFTLACQGKKAALAIPHLLILLNDQAAVNARVQAPFSGLSDRYITVRGTVSVAADSALRQITGKTGGVADWHQWWRENKERVVPRESHMPIHPGDKVVTTAETAVKVGARTVVTIPASTKVTAKAVKGDWVAITVQQDGKSITGWVEAKHLSSLGSRPSVPPTPPAPPAPLLRPDASGAGDATMVRGTPAVNDKDAVVTTGKLAGAARAAYSDEVRAHLSKAHMLVGQNKAEDPEFYEAVKSAASELPVVQLTANKNLVVWLKLTLNSDGTGLDAFRFTSPLGSLADLFWAFSIPRDFKGSWYIMPSRDTMKGFTEFKISTGQKPDGLEAPERNILVFQALVGGEILPNREYIIWFTTNEKHKRPCEIYVAMVLAPALPGRSISSAKDIAWQMGISLPSEPKNRAMPPSVEVSPVAPDERAELPEPFRGTWQQKGGDSRLVITANSIIWERKPEGKAEFPPGKYRVEGGGRRVSFTATETAYFDSSTGKTARHEVNVTLSVDGGRLTLNVPRWEMPVAGKEGLLVRSPGRSDEYERTVASDSEAGSKDVANATELTVYIGLKEFGIVRKGNVGSGWGQPKAVGMIGVGSTEEEAKLNLSPAKLTEDGTIVIEQKNAFKGLRTFRFQINRGELIPDKDTLERLTGAHVKKIKTVTKKFVD